MLKLRFLSAAFLIVSLSAGGCSNGPRARSGDASHAANAAGPAATPPKMLDINFADARAIDIPETPDELKAIMFTAPDGKEGWALRFPGGQPIATPAYSNGMIFVGGGYGSHEFYGIDAGTGEVRWTTKTDDDGPTAAVVEDGYVAFNTESCTIFVVNASDGHIVWQEWLGDPLMSQPAISNGRLFIAYPGGHPRGAKLGGEPVKGDGAQNNDANNPAPPAANPPCDPEPAPQQAAQVADDAGAGYRLLCADLKTGKHLWETNITADVISAPVIDHDNVYLTCFDGTGFCISAATGKVVWKKESQNTSAPLVVADGRVIVTQKEVRDGTAHEGIRRMDRTYASTFDTDRAEPLIATTQAQYLKPNSDGGRGALFSSANQALDSSVGFGGGSAPGSIGNQSANKAVGVSTVAGGWAYQGSRAAYSKNSIYNAQGRTFNCINDRTGGVSWQANAKGDGVDDETQVFSPPAMGKQNVYLCSGQGHLLAMDQSTGKVAFMYSTKLPISFQPALANGNMYVGTANGMLLCLKTGNFDADGWTAWGGNAQHNKKQ